MPDQLGSAIVGGSLYIGRLRRGALEIVALSLPKLRFEQRWAIRSSSRVKHFEIGAVGRHAVIGLQSVSRWSGSHVELRRLTGGDWKRIWRAPSLAASPSALTAGRRTCLFGYVDPQGELSLVEFDLSEVTDAMMVSLPIHPQTLAVYAYGMRESRRARVAIEWSGASERSPRQPLFGVTHVVFDPEGSGRTAGSHIGANQMGAGAIGLGELGHRLLVIAHAASFGGVRGLNVTPHGPPVWTVLSQTRRGWSTTVSPPGFDGTEALASKSFLAIAGASAASRNDATYELAILMH